MTRSNSRAPAKVSTTRGSAKKRLAAQKVGRKLYRETWALACAKFHDKERLKNWQRWQRNESKIDSVETAVKYANKMLASLKDNYTRLYSAKEVAYMQESQDDSFVGIGSELGMYRGFYIISGVTPGGPADKGGLKRKDIILALDGKSVVGLPIVELRPLLRGAIGSRLEMKMRRGREDVVLQVVRKTIRQNAVSAQVLPHNIGYLRLENFEQANLVSAASKALRTTLRRCKGLVIDLRGNEGGDKDLVFGIASLILEQGKLAQFHERDDDGTAVVEYSLTRRRLVKVENEDETIFRSSTPRRTRVLKRGVKVVVLIDKGSASCSELLAGALRDTGRALLVGEKSFGKGIAQGNYSMRGGTILAVTQYTYHTPKGHWPGDAHGVKNGLKPDVRVRSKARIYRSGFARDKQLQTACRLILRQD